MVWAASVKWYRAAVLGLVVWAAAGCAGKNPYPAGSYERALHYSERGKNLEAVGAFEAFVRLSPTDSLAAEAQFRKAMTYMTLEEYPLAAVEFQIMRKDYPISDLVEEALFHEGRAYLEQVGNVQRDVTGAHEARLHFLKFSQEYPGSKRMPEVVAYMQEISDIMVRKRLEQVKVYRQLKRYAAVAMVLDEVLVNEAGSSLIPQVMWERARVAQRLNDEPTRTRMYDGLINNHPDSSFGKRAARQGRAGVGLDQDDS